MVEIIDIILPIITLIISALLTLPVFKAIRKNNHRLALTLGWLLAIFIVAGAAVANLASKYYSASVSQPFVNLTLSGGTGSSPVLSSAFMVDAISVYMAIIIVAVSAIVMIYAAFFVNSNERPSERYFAIMLMLTAALLGAVLSGDLLTLLIFWEAAAAGAGFLMLFKKNSLTLNSTLKYLVMIIIASAFIVFGLSIVYGLTGSLNFWDVRQALVTLVDKRLLIIAFVFIAAGYAIDTAIVVFH